MHLCTVQLLSLTFVYCFSCSHVQLCIVQLLSRAFVYGTIKLFSLAFEYFLYCSAVLTRICILFQLFLRAFGYNSDVSREFVSCSAVLICVLFSCSHLHLCTIQLFSHEFVNCSAVLICVLFSCSPSSSWAVSPARAGSTTRTSARRSV